MKARHLLALSALLVMVAARRASAQLPSIPVVQDVSFFAGVAQPFDTNAWQDAKAIKTVGVEVGFLVSPKLETWRACQKVADCPTLVQAYTGFAVSSLDGDLTDSLSARSALRENYLGIGGQADISRSVGLYGSMNIRLTSFSSGRAYSDDAVGRPAFKLGGDGAGAAANIGVILRHNIFIEINFTSRYWPSIVVDPPSGMTLPADVPVDMWINTLGVSTGATFEFSKD